MKLWKCAAIALTLCGAALSVFLTRIMVPTRTHHPHFWDSPLSQSSSFSASSNSSSSLIGGRHRKARAVDGNSLLSEFIHMFQSFTEGELKHVIGTLVERKARRDAKQSKRTKRAKKGAKPCLLRDMEVTVSQLGLGYDSDEIILFRYCSGRCTASRRNYDMTLAFMKRERLLTRERREKVRHSPCCRPTSYEDDISFLDNSHRYHTIHEVSARECGCM